MILLAIKNPMIIPTTKPPTSNTEPEEPDEVPTEPEEPIEPDTPEETPSDEDDITEVIPGTPSTTS